MEALKNREQLLNLALAYFQFGLGDKHEEGLTKNEAKRIETLLLRLERAGYQLDERKLETTSAVRLIYNREMERDVLMRELHDRSSQNVVEVFMDPAMEFEREMIQGLKTDLNIDWSIIDDHLEGLDEPGKIALASHLKYLLFYQRELRNTDLERYLHSFQLAEIVDSVDESSKEMKYVVAVGDAKERLLNEIKTEVS